MLGYSGEDKAAEASETRGKFDDGLPSSTARLVADGVQISVWTCGRRYGDFSFKVDPHFLHECLHMRVQVSKSVAEAAQMRHLAADCKAPMCSAYRRGSAERRDVQPNWPSAKCSKDTLIQLFGIDKSDFDTCRYMFLHPLVQQDPCMKGFIRDGLADVILNTGFSGKIFVKDLLAQVSATSHGPQYGYNLKKFSVKSRDRQDTLCEDDALKQIATAWSRILLRKETEVALLARSKLYDALNNHPDRSEAAAMCDSCSSSMGHVWEALAEEFKARHRMKGFPVVYEDGETLDIITRKLKRDPVLISGKLFGCLAATESASYARSARQTWLEMRMKAIRDCSTESADLEPFQTITRVVMASLSDFYALPQVELVNASQLDDISVLYCPGAVAFELSGFENVQQHLCGIYKLCKGFVGNGKPVFRKVSEPVYHIFWTSRTWVISDAPLEILHRCASPIRNAQCSEQLWWAKQLCYWEVWSGSMWQTCLITASPITDFKSGRKKKVKKAKLFLNMHAIKKLLSPTGESSNPAHASATSFVRIFSRVFDAVLQDVKDEARCQISQSQEQDARERLMQEMMLLDRRKFQRHIDRLNGIERDAVRRKRLTAWLLCDSSDGSEEETDPEEEEVRRRIQEQIDLGILQLNLRRSDSLAWVGDTILDASLGVFGVERGLQPKELDQLRQKLFCAERMGCSARGLGRKRIREAAEFREQQVGKLAMEQKSALMSTFTKILGSATVPLEKRPMQECSFLTEITRSIHKASSSTDPHDWHNSSARQAVMIADTRAHAAKAHGCAPHWRDSSRCWGESSEDDKVAEKQSTIGRAICDDFLQGRCHHGMNRQCGKAHPCKFFQRGSCKHGSHCRFDHVSCPQLAG